MRLGLNGLQSTEVPNVDPRVLPTIAVSPALLQWPEPVWSNCHCDSWSSHFIACRMTGQHSLKSSDKSRRARASVWTVQWTGMTLELREKHQMLSQLWCSEVLIPHHAWVRFPRDKGWKRLWYQWSRLQSLGIVPQSLWRNSLKQVSQKLDSLNLSCSSHWVKNWAKSFVESAPDSVLMSYSSCSNSNWYQPYLPRSSFHSFNLVVWRKKWV